MDRKQKHRRSNSYNKDSAGGHPASTGKWTNHLPASVVWVLVVPHSCAPRSPQSDKTLRCLWHQKDVSFPNLCCVPGSTVSCQKCECWLLYKLLLASLQFDDLQACPFVRREWHYRCSLQWSGQSWHQQWVTSPWLVWWWTVMCES